MTRSEYDALLREKKTITGDITLVQVAKSKKSRKGKKVSATDIRSADDVRVQCGEGLELTLNIWSRPDLDSTVINVYHPRHGPFCRLCINGVEHGDAGETHKHEVNPQYDPSRRYHDRYAVPKPELAELDTEAAWQWFCTQANITHNGTLSVG